MFTVPNVSEASFLDQSEPDARDFLVLGDQALGVLDGLDIISVTDGIVTLSQGTVLVDGVPIPVDTSSVHVSVKRSSKSRYDFIVAEYNSSTNKAIVKIVKGTPATEPIFPELNTNTQCLLYAVYFPVGTTAVSLNNVVDKRVFVSPTFKRVYDSPDSVALEITNTGSSGGSFTTYSVGKLSWGTALLERASNFVLRISGSLSLLRDNFLNATFALTLKTNSIYQYALKIVDNIGNIKSFFTKEGVMVASNFKRGFGSPESVVVGSQGDLYIDHTATIESAIWYKASGNNTNTGWALLNSFTLRSVGVIPVGSVFPFVGPYTQDLLDNNFIVADGRSLLREEYPELFSIIGTTFGSTNSATFNIPDIRGRAVFGVGGIFKTPGFVAGNTVARDVVAIYQSGNLGVPLHNHDNSLIENAAINKSHTHSDIRINNYTLEESYPEPRYNVNTWTKATELKFIEPGGTPVQVVMQIQNPGSMNVKTEKIAGHWIYRINSSNQVVFIGDSYSKIHMPDMNAWVGGARFAACEMRIVSNYSRSPYPPPWGDEKGGAVRYVDYGVYSNGFLEPEEGDYNWRLHMLSFKKAPGHSWIPSESLKSPPWKWIAQYVSHKSTTQSSSSTASLGGSHKMNLDILNPGVCLNFIIKVKP